MPTTAHILIIGTARLHVPFMVNSQIRIPADPRKVIVMNHDLSNAVRGAFISFAYLLSNEKVLKVWSFLSGKS